MRDKLNPIEEAYINALLEISVTKYDQPINELNYLLTEWKKTDNFRNPVKREKLKVKINNWIKAHSDIPLSKYPGNVLELYKSFVVNYYYKYLRMSA